LDWRKRTQVRGRFAIRRDARIQHHRARRSPLSLAVPEQLGLADRLETRRRFARRSSDLGLVELADYDRGSSASTPRADECSSRLFETRNEVYSTREHPLYLEYLE